MLSLIAEENLASRRVAEKLGAHPDGVATVRGFTLTAFRINRDSWLPQG